MAIEIMLGIGLAVFFVAFVFAPIGMGGGMLVLPATLTCCCCCSVDVIGIRVLFGPLVV